jgi:hypothetical protein
MWRDWHSGRRVAPLLSGHDCQEGRRARVLASLEEGQEAEPSSDEKKAPESKLAGAKPMHFDADDEQPTREDREAGREKSKPGFPMM